MSNCGPHSTSIKRGHSYCELYYGDPRIYSRPAGLGFMVDMRENSVPNTIGVERTAKLVWRLTRQGAEKTAERWIDNATIHEQHPNSYRSSS